MMTSTYTDVRHQMKMAKWI